MFLLVIIIIVEMIRIYITLEVSLIFVINTGRYTIIHFPPCLSLEWPILYYWAQPQYFPVRLVAAPDVISTWS